MSKILINVNNVKTLIDKFFTDNKEYVKLLYRECGNKIICKFYAFGKECEVDTYLKSNGINPTVTGKNKDFAIPLVKYLESYGIKDTESGKQIVINEISLLEDLIRYITENFNGKISIEQNDKVYVLKGFLNDKVTITLNNKNFVIQGKPYYIFHIILNYLAEYSSLDFNGFINLTNTFSEITFQTNIIREQIKNILKNSYNYMEEAQLKSISSSFTFINKSIISEDFSGALTGVFKALEGYMKKLLSRKYGYTFNKTGAFIMFGKDKNTNKSQVDNDPNLSQDEKNCLNELYQCYTDKRNVYLHSTIDPSVMKIIEDYKEAEELRDEILETIERTYNILF